MITSTKNYTEKNPEKQKKWTDRTLGQMVKAKVCRENHIKSIHIHTDKRRKRKNMYIYIKKGREQPNQ